MLDRSWYNRAGVETVMGFCTPEERRAFLQQCPQFERLLVDDGIVLIKYWLSISNAEQNKRFQARAADPKRRWKLSPMDLHARSRFIDYSRAKDEMLFTLIRVGLHGTSSRRTTSVRLGSTA